MGTRPGTDMIMGMLMIMITIAIKLKFKISAIAIVWTRIQPWPSFCIR